MRYMKETRVVWRPDDFHLIMYTFFDAPWPVWDRDVIMQVDIGDLKSGKYMMKATITTIQPHAKIPFHLHKNNGLRYMLEGSLSISWKDGQFQTFSAGSTYFEGPGANHPEGVMAASNPADLVAKVLIIELVPLD